MQGQGYSNGLPAYINFVDYLNKNSPKEADKLKWAGQFRDRFFDEVERKGRIYGAKLPWEKTHNKIRIKPVGLSLWQGYNGHKKSLLTGQVALNLAYNQKVCIASFEMPPEQTLIRMCRQWNEGFPNKFQASEFIDWANENIVIYEENQTVSPHKLLGMTYYAIKELGCQHVFIDSLTKCGIRVDDLDGQRSLVDRLAWMSSETKTGHIHMVCHCKKGDETRIPTRYDIRGASEISDLADNVFICWANKEKKQIEELSKIDPQAITKQMGETLREPDQTLRVDKQRGESFEADIGLNFNSQSLTFF